MKLKVFAGVRYWEDTDVDGVEDVDGKLIPCREGDNWCPIINIENGIIENWENGKKASIHYKVCDCCGWQIVKNGEVIKEIDGEYVPEILSPADRGFGDYIIMNVDESGRIHNWNKTLIDSMIG